MDSFEDLLSTLFNRKGYWTKTNFKVELTKAEKVQIERPSSPRWEIDLIAYKPKENELLMIESKSYLDSGGVHISSFDGSNKNNANRFKLFNEETLQRVVFNRLKIQLEEQGLINKNPSTKLCLVAGKIDKRTKEQVMQFFNKKGWLIFDDEWLKNELKELSYSGYENTTAAYVSKLLLRT